MGWSGKERRGREGEVGGKGGRWGWVEGLKVGFDRRVSGWVGGESQRLDELDGGLKAGEDGRVSVWVWAEGLKVDLGWNKGWTAGLDGRVGSRVELDGGLKVGFGWKG